MIHVLWIREDQYRLCNSIHQSSVHSVTYTFITLITRSYVYLIHEGLSAVFPFLYQRCTWTPLPQIQHSIHTTNYRVLHHTVPMQLPMKCKSILTQMRNPPILISLEPLACAPPRTQIVYIHIIQS